MDFARPLVPSESVASKSKIRYLEPVTVETAVGDTPEERAHNSVLDNQVIAAANQTAAEMFLGEKQQQLILPSANGGEVDATARMLLDASGYTERSTPVINNGCIKAGDLVVIQESFDKLDFVYVKPGEIFQNRNGAFHHDDFINQPFGTKLRSRDLQGYGFLFLLKPTPELWTRSLNHRTQVVHELDQSQIIFQLYLQPNQVVVESGTGSGAMSHAVIRTVAPAGHLHTYEFNQHRAVTARTEFQQHGLGHLVTVHHKDVCRGLQLMEAMEDANGSDEKKTKPAAAAAQLVQEGLPGFDLPGQTVDAVFLDLPEPWLAVPHAAFVLKANARIATYSPCVEQTQRTIQALEATGFHSIKTLEYRLQEHYVDEVEYEAPPADKRPRPEPHNVANYQQQLLQQSATAGNDTEAGEDTGAEADNEVSETDTEIITSAVAEDSEGPQHQPEATPATTITNAPQQPPPPIATTESSPNGKNGGCKMKRKKMLVARPFVTMRGHSAFLTFATAGLEPQPDPNTTLRTRHERMDE